MTESLARDDTATADSAAAPTSRWAAYRERRRNRVSKWDRPPDPKDWRYFVGTLGKVLIATGLLMFGFVAYQLWGTGIETARAQNSLESTFEDKFAAAVAARAEEPEATVAPPDTADETADETADSVSDTIPSTDATGSVPAEDGFDVEGAAAEISIRPPSEVVPGGVDLSDEAVEQNVPIVPGEAFARLEIPTIGVDQYVVPGVRLTDLKKGPGHYPDTPLPGQLGNASIAGHRTTYGAPFFDLGELTAGDEIVVTMITGDRFVYRVTGLEVVTAADSWVISTRDPNVAELTLTTCHPKYTARDRLVVHSVLVPDESARVGVAEFSGVATDDPAAADDTAPGDDPVVGATSHVEDVTTGTAPVTTVAGDERQTVETLVPPATTAAAPTSVVAVATDEPVTPTTVLLDANDEIDAFSEGWFHDRDAFPQIALWGIALTLISIGAYQISKKTRHDSIGFAAGILPFLFCLYFFFQNINRLLPPGL